MKRIVKNPPPQSLIDYTSVAPNSTWEQMRNDGINNGYTAYQDCRAQAVKDQKGLCAYCEQVISIDDPLRCSIEHFHPKSDQDESHNWALDWNNIFAVCDGGSRSTSEEQHINPLPQNLSCDAHKSHMMHINKLPVSCEGYLINPLDMPAFPNLFAFNKGTGFYEPNETTCAMTEIPGNELNTTVELVENTISTLNLNCNRLATMRRMLVINIDQNIKQLRKKNYTPAEVPAKLIDRYFINKIPEFFTTLRCCLGETAENYLESINYDG